MQPRRNVDRRDDLRMRRIAHVQDGGPVRRLHVSDIGVIAVQDDLAATGDIDPGNLANAGTMTHGALPFSRSDGVQTSPFSGGRDFAARVPALQTRRSLKVAPLRLAEAAFAARR